MLVRESVPNHKKRRMPELDMLFNGVPVNYAAGARSRGTVLQDPRSSAIARVRRGKAAYQMWWHWEDEA